MYSDSLERRSPTSRAPPSDGWLGTAIDHAPGMYFIFDCGGICLAARGGGLAASGRKRRHFVGRSAFDLPEVMGDDVAAIRRALAGEPSTWRVEIGGRSFAVACRPEGGENGAFEGVFVVANDITDFDHDADASRAEARRLRLVIDNLPCAIAYVNIERRYRFVNERYAAWFGLARDGIGGSPAQGPPGPEMHGEPRDLLEPLASGRELSRELTHTYPDGVTRDANVTIVPDRDANGDLCGALILHTDITEQDRVSRVEADAHGYSG